MPRGNKLDAPCTQTYKKLARGSYVVATGLNHVPLYITLCHRGTVTRIVAVSDQFEVITLMMADVC